MSNEEFERKMEFILEQQAQFASDIQQLREVQAQTGQHLTQTEQLLTRLVNVTHEGFKDVNAKIDALVDSQIGLSQSHVRLSEAHVRLSEAQAQLSEGQARTDEALRNLTVLVDRYFRDRGNGQP